jgi:Family of unknown function (DUF6228)
MECTVRLDADGKSAEMALSMIQPYREDTLAFFDELSSKPDGWLGSADWYSEHNEIGIRAHGNGTGLVALDIELRPLAHLEATAAARLLVRYNELRRFTSSLGNFLRVPHAPAGQGGIGSPLGRWSFTDRPGSSRTS